MPQIPGDEVQQTRLRVLSKERADLLTFFLDKHFAPASVLTVSHARLVESVRYSLLQEGGKRFRPVLAMLVAEALGKTPADVVPYAAAVECIHTYSLIHDDLPAMDNDDMRRGQPTNHRQFDEATAILAGDALLTEAFRIIADSYQASPKAAVSAIAELAHASGLKGMVGGQAIDMASKKDQITLDELRVMHSLKTGALIRSAARGAALICGASAKQLQDLTLFAENLGLAFQVADDILDYDPQKPEPGSYPALMGVEKTKGFLGELTQTCLTSLASFDERAEPLRALSTYNQSRLI